jgi:chromosome partitioning protein
MEQSTPVFTVVNQKGGVGKTTTTVNLGAVTAQVFPPLVPDDVAERLEQLASAQSSPEVEAEVDTLLDQCQAQVLVVSTDPQGSSTYWLDKVAAAKRKARVPMPLDHAQEHKRPEVLSRLKSARRYKGGIFVDSPGWLPPDDDELQVEEPVEQGIVRATLVSADLVIVPIEPEDLAFKPTERTIETVIKPMGKPFIVVVNNWDPRDGLGDLNDTRKRVKRRGWPLAETTIRRYKLHTSASAAGRLCIDYPNNRTALEAQKDFLRLNLELKAAV